MTVRHVVAALLGFGVAAPALAQPDLPFHGTWECRQVIEGAVAHGGWREDWNSEGLKVAGSDRPVERATVKPSGPHEWSVTLQGGAAVKLSLPAPYVLLRATLEHAYVCLRVAPVR